MSCVLQEQVEDAHKYGARLRSFAGNRCKERRRYIGLMKVE